MGPLGEQYMLLTAESSLRPTAAILSQKSNARVCQRNTAITDKGQGMAMIWSIRDFEPMREESRDGGELGRASLCLLLGRWRRLWEDCLSKRRGGHS